jgi:hypothetical protein
MAMKYYCFLFLFFLNYSLFAKEWKNLKSYQKISHQENLLPSDWLSYDRINNTLIWQQANLYNLSNNLPQEYTNIIQRRDFYNWIDSEIKARGNEVLWFRMAYFISSRLYKMETLPLCFFTNKNILSYAYNCSESIFNQAFVDIKKLYESDTVLTEKEALQWDKDILYKEQCVWVNDVINSIDSKGIKKIENILQGKFLYSLLVPKEIRFYDDLSNSDMRYNYAIQALRPYCENILK